LENESDEKQSALKLAKIFNQAFDLQSFYSDQSVSKVKDIYPALYAYMITGYKEGVTYAVALL
jgi:hypothetical protein